MRQDELEAAWMWIETITSNWKAVNQQNILYEAGTWGPSEAEQLIERDGRQWRRL